MQENHHSMNLLLKFKVYNFKKHLYVKMELII